MARNFPQVFKLVEKTKLALKPGFMNSFSNEFPENLLYHNIYCLYKTVLTGDVDRKHSYKEQTII